MRNIYDQYTQPENRVTHALVASLSRDPWLLKSFVTWVTGERTSKFGKLSIVEQRLPGEPESDEEESARRGLPDGWIYDGNDRALLIESKVAANLVGEQLRRHYRTAQHRGYANPLVLALDVVAPRKKLPEWVIFRRWSDVYAWLKRQSLRSEWARIAAEYLEIAERKFAEEGYLKEGSLTVFSGIPFGPDEPYNYPEAKRVLKLAMEELRGRKDLVRELGMNPGGEGRGAITGRDGMLVWDFLQIKDASKSKSFTSYPHLTLGLHSDHALVIITVPNAINQTFRRNLLDLDENGFIGLMARINTNLVRELRGARGAVPWVDVVQRRYPSQRAEPLLDAAIRFDLRTAFDKPKGKDPVKTQPQWLEAVWGAFSQKRSNLQLGIGASFPYRSCSMTRRPEILDYIAATWVASRPLLDVMRGSQR